MTAEEILSSAIRQIIAAGHDVPNWLIVELIDRLPPRQSMAMRLHWVDRIRNKTEIARRMGIADKNVHANLKRGYVSLAAAIVARFPDVDISLPSPGKPT